MVVVSKPSPTTLRLILRVTPNARDTTFGSFTNDSEAIPLRVAAPPRDGESNIEIIRFIAKTLGYSKSSVEIVKGHKSRDKVVEVDGVKTELEEVMKKLQNLADD